MNKPDMNDGRIRKVVIAGGGTAGWLAACALSHQLHGLVDIVLVESEEIGTVGVGESTVPPIRAFHRLMQIDEREFMREVAGAFKLGISFENWRRPGEKYFHPFGITGQGTWACAFHHFWLESRARGMQSELGDFCLETLAAREQRFGLGTQPEVNYAYHFDAFLYARYLRRICEGRGVRRIEGKIQQVLQHPESGFVRALEMVSGELVEGDLFVDCTGFRGLLIEQTLQTGFEDWRQWLPCDRAVAVQTTLAGPPVPYTRAIAHEAGWRWHIALQHRSGNGRVYSSAHLSDDEATARLLQECEGKSVKDPWLLRLRTGRRRKAWNRNVVALGLASGFIEPLESTSIHLIMSGVVRLVRLFPTFHSQALADQYNDESRKEMEHVRDFIILHYHANQRDEPMWRDCREMSLPDSLVRRMQLFRDRAHAWQGEDELFRIDSWTHVMLGQGIEPASHHPVPRAMSDADLRRLLDSIRGGLTPAVAAMPSHQQFLNRHCPAGEDVWARVRK